jgi:pyruvate ferredoxin oxidoreductase alpha subunit/2-oxoisovalerate ferredoxin oxidoreductase alpha subunit
MVNVNRAVLAPWCLYADHQDSISQRDTGWLQFYCASHQEIYDTVFLAYKTAEQLDLPVMINYDGFLLSHSMLPFNTVDDETIARFLPARQPAWRLHPRWGGTFSNVAMAAEYAALRSKLAEDILGALPVIKEAISEYAALTGRPQPGLIEAAGPKYAKVYLLSMGSMAAEMELAAEELTRQGIRATSLKLRLYRPFPAAELIEALPQGCTLIVLERDQAYGHPGGALLMEARAALYDCGKDIRVIGAAIGLGGEDLPASVLTEEIRKLWEAEKR